MAKKKRGMSMEEKEVVMYKIFLGKQEPFHFKEVEKLSMKAGIGQLISDGNIKQVLENLIADDKVTTERIGSSNYYWTFPGDQMIKNRKLNEEMDKLEQNIAQLESDIKQEQEGKEDTKERQTLENELNLILQKLEVDQAKLNKIQTCGPIAMSNLRKEKNLLEQELSHYIDQIQVIKYYLKSEYQNNYDEQGFNKQYDIDPKWEDY